MLSELFFQILAKFTIGHLSLIAVVLVLGVLISWTWLKGAPWAPTSRKLARKMLSLANVGPDDLVYDLGCGDGRLVTIAAKECGARAVGVEIDPLRYLWCQVLITILGLRDRVRIVFGDFFKMDLSNADVVTCYLLQETNDKLEGKLKKELRGGTRIVSNTFMFSNIEMSRWDGQAKLYIIRIEPKYL